MESKDINKEKGEAQKPKTVLELIVAEKKEISHFSHSVMVIKIKELDRRLAMRYLDEDVERLVKIEYDSTLEFLEREHNKILLTNFSLTPVEMEIVSQQFKIYQQTGQLVSKRNIKTDAIKVEWYEFFKKKKIVGQFADLLNGDEDKFKESDWISLCKTLGKNVPDDLKDIYSDPQTADVKFIRYMVHLHFESVYLQNLKARLEPDCDENDDNCKFKADAEAYKKLKEELELDGNKDTILTITKPKFGNRKPDDSKTSLTQEQTIMFIDYLMSENIIVSNSSGYQSQANIAKAFQGLTGYGHDNLRQKLGKVQELKSNSKQDIREVKKKLENILSLISNDLDKK